MTSPAPHIKVCEFYSGIGGYHIALSSIPDISFDVVAAFEISSNANIIYRHNFPSTTVLETNLCGLSADKLDRIIHKSRVKLVPSNPMTSPSNPMTSSVNPMTSTNDKDVMTSLETATMFVMSPPCQPFTRQGCKKDDTDPRSESVLHLFKIFPDLQHVPEYFFIENVQGFETSKTRSIIMEFFTSNNYHVVEFLLNSNSLGIPNSRLRYYLLARKQPFPELLSTPGIHTYIPNISSDSHPPPLSAYLETEPQGFEISDKFLSKWGWVLDIVTGESKRSCCFTKSYSVKAEGSGSVIQQAPDKQSTAQETLGAKQGNEPNNSSERDSATKTGQNTCPNNHRSMTGSTLTGDEFLEHMKSLNLRYFTPLEIARIHGVPEWYELPSTLSNKQLYKLLGNGLNVTVVKSLIENVLLR